ncbi:hypothetical protein BU16DRAFT_547877 [Lophium mytilinum]|uniref:Alpha/beta hydrolase fold-3 domain-containing protein n=1 Tax=Lophium mytilinum TaxID=390894 RepID=A0A6A6R871_9PEZI|nr:hypothetical protein BU16DRAFT_547877 [Lophium mytilinum]
MAPGQKYGHLSAMGPEFAPFKPISDAFAAKLWDRPLKHTRAMLKMPLPFPDFVPKADEFQITERTVPVRDGTEIGIKIYSSKAKGKADAGGAVLFYVMHGGGWVVGSHGIEEVMNRYVARDNGAVVVSVDYRLAPEFRYPYAVNDSFDVLLWCKNNAKELGINSERIIVGGSSAGGNLAAVMALKARNEKITGIIGQILNIPATCHPDFYPAEKYELGSWEQNKDASGLSGMRMQYFWDQYTPEPTREEYASPLLAKSLEGLPPALIQVAGLDPLRDEALAYADALQAAGVQVTVQVYPGLPHGFGAMMMLETASKRYQSANVNWIRYITDSIASSKL